MTKPIIRNFLSSRRVTARIATEGAKAQQQFKDECDMNRIVRNAQRGIPPKYLAQGVAQYGDFADVPDLASAFDLVANAHAAFERLPALLRHELGNDPTRIGQLTKDQIERYKLGKEAPSRPSAASSSAGQADEAGTEPADPTPPKGGSSDKKGRSNPTP